MNEGEGLCGWAILLRTAGRSKYMAYPKQCFYKVAGISLCDPAMSMVVTSNALLQKGTLGKSLIHTLGSLMNYDDKH